MFLAQEEAVPFEYPVHGPVFTANEVQELLSLLQSPSPSQNSRSRGSNQAVYSINERKRRRTVSNREAAQRSRWKKKRHLEDLTQQLNPLKIVNRELKNQLDAILNKSHVLWRENDHLMSESTALKARFSNLCHVFVAMNAMQQSQFNHGPR